MITIKNFLFRTSGKHRCVVLYYHSVLDSQRDRFITQLEYLSKKYSFVSLSTLTTLPSRKNLISITFDDGLSSILKNAIPELLDKQIPTTIFVPAAKINSYPNWEQKDQEIYSDDRIISRDEIRKLSNSGIEIASHTLNHADLRKIQTDEAREELQKSKFILEDITGKKIISFSFPYGSFNEGLIYLALDCGYNFVYTTEPEIISLPTDEKVFGRVSAEPDDSMLEFKLKVAGAYSWLPRAINLKRKVKKYFAM